MKSKAEQKEITKLLNEAAKAHLKADKLKADIWVLKSDLRNAIADYMRSEGCSCCRNEEDHKAATAQLAKLLKVKKYSDGSGYDFGKYESKAK